MIFLEATPAYCKQLTYLFCPSHSRLYSLPTVPKRHDDPPTKWDQLRVVGVTLSLYTALDLVKTHPTSDTPLRSIGADGRPCEQGICHAILWSIWGR